MNVAIRKTLNFIYFGLTITVCTVIVGHRILFAASATIPIITLNATTINASTTMGLKLLQDLRLGMTGAEVHILQNFLVSDIDLNFQPSVPGRFGPRTARALKEFQRSSGITPTGILGPVTRGYINNLLDSNASFGSSTINSLEKTIATVQSHTTPDPVPLLIEFYHTPGTAEITELSSFGATIKHIYHLIPAVAANIPKEHIQNLLETKNIKLIEIDQNAFKRSASPNPILISTASDYASSSVSDLSLTHLSPIHISNSSQTTKNVLITKRSHLVNVAVMDTGIDYTHPDITAYYAGGYNFIDNSTNAMDDNDHGTHVAGIILKTFKKYVGLPTREPLIKLYSLKVLDAKGSGFFSNIIAALEWAVDHHMNIINNSYGTSIDPGKIVLEAFNNADRLGVMLIAAAGNTGSCKINEDTVEYPARYPSVVAVTAVNDKNIRPCFSSSGEDIEIAAPGVSIVSTKRGGGYITFSGTSMSSPYVTAGAAIIFSQNTVKYKRMNDAVRNIIDQNSDDLGAAGRDNFFGFGVMNIPKALNFIKTSSLR